MRQGILEQDTRAIVRTDRFSAVRERPQYFILGVRVDNVDGETAMRRLEEFIVSRTGMGARSVVFTNVHSIHLARKNPEFRRSIYTADAAFADGSGLAIAGRLLRRPILENLNGTDFTPRLLHEAERRGWSVYLLGAQHDVIRRCHSRLRATFPRLKIIGARDGFFADRDEEIIIDEIRDLGPDIVLVGMGSPFQEQWIARNAHRLRAGACLAVGGLFDFISEKRKRSPVWMRRLGIEWVYRFLHDPGSKWDRVFMEIPLFLLAVLRERRAELRERSRGAMLKQIQEGGTP